MHAIAHGGCTNNVRESALMAVGKEVCYHTEDSTLRQQRTRPGDQPSYIPTLSRNKNWQPTESPDLCLAKQKRYPPLQPQAQGKKEAAGVNCGIWCTSQALYYFIWGRSYHTAPMNLDSKIEMYSHDSHVVHAWIYVKYCFVFDATFLMLLTLLNCHLFYWNICCMFYVNDSQNENFCAQADGKVGLGLCSVKWPVAATSQARQWRCEWWMLSSPPLPCTAGPLCSKTSW